MASNVVTAAIQEAALRAQIAAADDIVRSEREAGARITDLESKDKTATGKTKTQLDASLPNIRSLRENVNTEYRSLEYASALTWDDAKARVDKAYDELKKAIDKAD